MEPNSSWEANSHSASQEISRSVFTRGRNSETLCIISCQAFPFRWGVVSPSSITRTGGSPLIGCRRLPLKYIRSCPPYLEAVSFIHNAIPWWQGPILVIQHKNRGFSLALRNILSSLSVVSQLNSFFFIVNAEENANSLDWTRFC
jgi:hypothetical protein